MLYEILLEKTLIEIEDVEANSPEEAEQIAKQMHSGMDVIVKASHMTGVTSENY